MDRAAPKSFALLERHVVAVYNGTAELLQELVHVMEFTLTAPVGNRLASCEWRWVAGPLFANDTGAARFWRERWGQIDGARGGDGGEERVAGRQPVER